MFWGMLFGLIFLTPLFGLAVGAAIGALGGAFRDYGIDDDFIKRVRGGILVQDPDGSPEPRELMEVVTKTQPSEDGKTMNPLRRPVGAPLLIFMKPTTKLWFRRNCLAWIERTSPFNWKIMC
jgi:hypothetical protein